MKRRILSILLSLALVFGSTPLPASAAAENNNAEYLKIDTTTFDTVWVPCTFEEAVEQAVSELTSAIRLTGNVALTAPITFSGDQEYTLYLNGKTISPASGFPSSATALFSVTGVCTVAEKDPNGSPMLSGTISATGTLSAFQVAESGSLILQAGTINSETAAAVQVGGTEASFSISGGAVKSTGGHAAAVSGGGTLYLSGSPELVGAPNVAALAVDSTGCIYAHNGSNLEYAGNKLTVAYTNTAESYPLIRDVTTNNAHLFQLLGNGSHTLVEQGGNLIYTKVKAHEHDVCGGTACGDHAQNVVAWQALIDPAQPLSGGYFLTGDMTVVSPITISDKVSLCLNGYSLTYQPGARSAGPLFNVTTGGALTLCDCSTGGGLNMGTEAAGQSPIAVTGGALNLYGGTVTGGHNVPAVVVTAGTAALYGGAIKNLSGTAVRVSESGKVMLSSHLGQAPVLSGQSDDGDLSIGCESGVSVGGYTGGPVKIGVDTGDENTLIGKTLITGFDSEAVAQKFSCNGHTLLYAENGLTLRKETKKPVIVSESLIDKTIYYGTDTTLSVIASSNNSGIISYQWYRKFGDNKPFDGDMISGAVNSAYTVSGKSNNAGGPYYYYCVVTNTLGDAIGLVHRPIAALTVQPKILPEPTNTGSLTYNGRQQAAEFNGFEEDAMTASGNVATDAGNYTATVSLSSLDNYKWADDKIDPLSVGWTIAPKPLSEDMIGAIPDQIYAGGSVTPEPTVSWTGDNGNTITLEKNTDFTYSYLNNNGTGTATVIINAKENSNYTGIAQKTFQIVSAAPTTYSVTFTGGEGATGTAPSQEAAAAGKKFTLPQNTFTKSGFIFIGWHDGINRYQPGAEYTMPAKTVTFTAQWAQSPAITAQPQAVTVRAGDTATFSVTAMGEELTYQWQVTTDGGASWAVVSGAAEAVLTVPQASTDMSGRQYRCVVKNAAGEAVSNAAVLTVTADVPEMVTVTFDSQGGASVEAQTIPKGGKLASLPQPTRIGYHFQGWHTQAGGGAEVTTDTVFDTNTTVYAHWSANGGTGSGSGGGSYAPPTYPPEITETEGGHASVSPMRPERGDTVTITPDPDQGYELGGITATDRDGNELHLKDNGNGTFSFTQPGYKVHINISYRALACDGGHDCPTRRYYDASPEEWYHEALDYVIAQELMIGYPDISFQPNGPLSRGMAATILQRIAGHPAIKESSAFLDTPDDLWCAGAVRWAAAYGVAQGYGDGRFGPDDAITREQLAAMLWRYAGSPAATSKELYFADVDQVSGYAREALCWAVEQGIICGRDGERLDPKGQVTRAQTAAILMRYCGVAWGCSTRTM